MLEFLGCLSVFFIFYAYFGYPIALLIVKPFFLFSRKSTNTLGQSTNALAKSGISIVIACRNEEKVLKEKIENTLTLSCFGHTVLDELKSSNPKVQVIVASDASDDNTHSIAESYSGRGVLLVASIERNGKEAAQKKSLSVVNQDLILFTDAKIILRGSVLENILEHFKDPSIGAVSSTDLVIDENGQSGEGIYVDYEMGLRKLETSVYSLIGLSGSCFAVRKEVTKNFPEGVPSDFCMLLEARRLGLRGVHAENVVAEYKAVKSHGAEFERKVRTIVRGMNSVWHYRDLVFSFKNPFLMFQLFSHKIFRWLVPFFGIFVYLVSLIVMFDSFFWLIVFCLATLVFGFAIQGYIDPSSRNKAHIKICFFFCLTNIAILFAWQKFIFGDKKVVWNPSDKG